jgi:hypothetical protein
MDLLCLFNLSSFSRPLHYSFLIGTLNYDEAKQKLQDLSVELGLTTAEVLYMFEEGKRQFDSFMNEQKGGPSADIQMNSSSNSTAQTSGDKLPQVSASKENLQTCGNITFDSNKARQGNGNLIVQDINTGKDFGVNRNDDGSYRFDCGQQQTITQ